MMHTITMTPSQWAGVQINPRQRDVERHAKKILGDFVPWQEQGASVQAAILPNGTLVKLNGHTRSYLWENRMIHVPELLHVQAVDARDMDHVIEMYYLFDNRKNVETSDDLITGCMRDLGIEPKSKLFQSGKFSTAVRYLAMSALQSRSTVPDMFESVKEWKTEILHVDRLIEGRNIAAYPSWILGAMFISSRKYGEAISDFWEAYLDPNTEDFNTSPVIQLRMVLSKNRGKSSGFGNLRDFMGKALSATDHHIAGNRISHLKGVLPAGYIKNKARPVSSARMKRSQRSVPVSPNGAHAHV